MQIGTRLRRIRQTRKQTLAEVGAATDISISYLSRIERCLTEPTLGTLNRLSGHFDVSVAEFFDDSPISNQASFNHRPSFREFIERMNGQVDTSMQDLLLHLDTVASRPAESVDEWLRYYYVVSSVTAKG